MNKFNKIGLAIGLVLSSSVIAQEVETDLTEKESYAIGLELGKHVSSNIETLDSYDIKYDVKMVLKGVNDRIKNKINPEDNNIDITESESATYIKAINDKIVSQSKLKEQETLSKNEAYLRDNSQKDGVFVTNSGLQYKILKLGKGEKPSSSSTSVTVHYEGTFLNGEVFDSSYKRNSPADFKLNQVIKGWTEGVQLMNVGSVYEFTIPSDLAYGDSGTPRIPAKSTLIFKVELLKIN